MKSFRWFAVLLLGCALAAVSSAVADVSLPAVIGDHMVLQQEAAVPIWGTADPGERVTVTLGKQQVSAVADEGGKWQVTLKAPRAGGPYEMTVSGKNSIALKDILSGEVWVCSGQSNMAMSVRRSNNPEREIASADYPKIRLFAVKRIVADQPLTDVTGVWAACDSQTVANFSAVGYFFGRDLHKTLKVPIGLIHTSWGGTPAEAWTSRPTLEAGADFQPILDRWAKALENYPKAKEEYDQKLAQWKEDVEKAKAEGQKPPRRPGAPRGPGHPHMPSGLYNGMIAPLLPYAIQGAIWYQGESNAGRAHQYRTLFPTMIVDWRRAWGQGDFPFLFVQLANFKAEKPEPGESDWAELREAQTMTLELPKTGMAVIIDIGEADDIHPKNKQDVGRRLALAARSVAYGQKLTYSGPMYKTMSVEGNKVRLSFDHIGGGLVARGGDGLKGFAVAGADSQFVWAEAKIDGKSIVVWSDQVASPVAVRYAWADNPACNLYNKEGLPALPFRTDDWPGVTFGKR